MKPTCFVLDFDGTFTDVEREGAPFTVAYRKMVADLLGRADVGDEWARAETTIAADPGRYGWEHGGHIVAPGNADPYVRCTTCAQLLFAAAGVLRDEATRTSVVQGFYQLAYKHTVTAFRPDARATLEALLATGRPVYVVTNSRTDVVKKKLEELAPKGGERLRVIGDAQKYVITTPAQPDARWAALPAEERWDGLPRPVCLGRGRYYDAIARVLAETGARPEELLVCGDIYELDLAVPLALGCGAHLVTGPATAAFERAAIARAGARGSHGAAISDVLARL